MYGVADHAWRQAGLEADHPGDVGGVSRLADVAENELGNLLGLDARAGQQFPHDDRPQIVGGDQSERSAGLALRCAKAVQNGNPRSVHDLTAPECLTSPVLGARKGCAEILSTYQLMIIAPMARKRREPPREPPPIVISAFCGPSGC